MNIFQGTAETWPDFKRKILEESQAENCRFVLSDEVPLIAKMKISDPILKIIPSQEQWEENAPKAKGKSNDYESEVTKIQAENEEILDKYLSKLNTITKVKDQWDRARAKAFDILRKVCSNRVKNQLYKEFESGDPKTIYEKLVQLYEAPHESGSVQLFRRLAKLEYKGNISAVINEIEEIYGSLKLNNIELSDEQKLSYLYICLETMRDQEARTRLINLQMKKSNWDEVTQDLIEFEARVGRKQPKLVAHKAEAVVAKDKSKIKDKCLFCDKSGHRIEECRFMLAAKRRKSRKAMSARVTRNEEDDEEYYVGGISVLSCDESAGDTRNIRIGLDSCAANHVFNESHLISNVKSCESTVIKGFNGSTVVCNKTGSLLDFDNGFVVKNASNLLSLNQLIKQGYKVSYDQTKNEFVVIKNKQRWIFRASNNGIYEMTNEKYINMVHSEEDNVACQELNDLHAQLGHPSDKTLSKILKSRPELTKQLKHHHINKYRKKLGPCQSCLKGKTTNGPFRSNTNKQVLESDYEADIFYVEGNMFLLMVQVSTGYMLCGTLEDKTTRSILEMFTKLHARILSHGREIKCITTDSEATLQACADELGKNKIRLRLKGPGEHAKTVERHIRTIKDKTRTLLNSLPYNLPKELVKYAVLFGIYKLNRTVRSQSEAKSPYELFSGKQVQLTGNYLLEFGCIVEAKRPYLNNTMNQRTDTGILIGIIPDSDHTVMIYNLYNQKIYRRNHVTRIKMSSDIMKKFNLQKSEDFDDDPTEDSENEEYFSNPFDDREVSINAVDVDAAAKEELSQLLDTKVFEPVRNIPNGATRISSFMLFKQKINADGSLGKYKARMVANGRHQTNVSSSETSSPTVDITSFLTLLNVAIHNKMHHSCLDVKGAYLNASLNKDTYMIIDKKRSHELIKMEPTFKEYIQKNGTLLVKLRKALYGLKEAALLWYKLMNKTLLEYGFIRNKIDECVYYLDRNGSRMYVALYVDDISLFYDKKDDFIMFKKFLEGKFTITMSEKEKISYLGMEFEYSNNNSQVQINQIGFIETLLKKFKVEGTAKYPSLKGFFNHKESDTCTLLEDEERKKFISIVMSLLYLAKRTRQDILLSVSYLTTKLIKPSKQDMENVEMILKYLNGTKDYKQKFKCNDLNIYIYTDASYLTHHDGKGHSGVFISIGKDNGSVYTKSNKQKIATHSSTEAELVALNDGIRKGKLIRDFLIDMNIEPRVMVFQDNKSCIKLASDGPRNIKSKHINAKYFFVKELLDNKEIEMKHVPSKEMVADFYTKLLFGKDFYSKVSRILGANLYFEENEVLRGRVG